MGKVIEGSKYFKKAKVKSLKDYDLAKIYKILVQGQVVRLAPYHLYPTKEDIAIVESVLTYRQYKNS